MRQASVSKLINRRAPLSGPQGLNAITEPDSRTARQRVFLVSLAEDADVLPRFRAAFAKAFAQGDARAYDIEFAHETPAGPGIVGIAIAPPVTLTAAHLATLPHLRIAAVASAGYDHVDAAALAARGIPIAHTPGYCDIEVADHAIAMACALLRNLQAGDAHVRAGGWSSHAVRARRITGATLGVVGLGRTGVLVARRAAGLGMRVIAWAPRTRRTKPARSAPSPSRP
jgi:lactate dehydrogenase-like 2-hydroxyacid dehydrogenase